MHPYRWNNAQDEDQELRYLETSESFKWNHMERVLSQAGKMRVQKIFSKT